MMEDEWHDGCGPRARGRMSRSTALMPASILRSPWTVPTAAVTTTGWAPAGLDSFGPPSGGWGGGGEEEGRRGSGGYKKSAEWVRVGGRDRGGGGRGRSGQGQRKGIGEAYGGTGLWVLVRTEAKKASQVGGGGRNSSVLREGLGSERVMIGLAKHNHLVGEGG